jgi:hypothetical protein
MSSYDDDLHKMEEILARMDAVIARLGGKVPAEDESRHLVAVEGKGWEEFLEGHPELETIDLPRIEATDEQIIAAVRQAATSQYPRWGPVAWSSDVADVLRDDCEHPTKRPGDLVRQDTRLIAKRLSRLADEGRIVRLKHRHSRTTWWTLQDLERKLTPQQRRDLTGEHELDLSDKDVLRALRLASRQRPVTFRRIIPRLVDGKPSQAAVAQVAQALVRLRQGGRADSYLIDGTKRARVWTAS